MIIFFSLWSVKVCKCRNHRVDVSTICRSILLWRFSHANTDAPGWFCMSALVQVSSTHLLTLRFSVCAEEEKKLQWPFNETIVLVVVCCNMLGFVCFRLMVMSCWLWSKSWTLPRRDQPKWKSWTRLSIRKCHTLLLVTWPLSMPSSGVWLHRKLWRSVYWFKIPVTFLYVGADIVELVSSWQKVMYSLWPLFMAHFVP